MDFPSNVHHVFSCFLWLECIPLLLMSTWGLVGSSRQAVFLGNVWSLIFFITWLGAWLTFDQPCPTLQATIATTCTTMTLLAITLHALKIRKYYSLKSMDEINENQSTSPLLRNNALK